MNKNEIKTILVNRGYNEKDAELVSADLEKIDVRLKNALDEWLQTETEIDVQVNDISIKLLIEERKYTYPAALLTLDWIYKEPKIALDVICRKHMCRFNQPQGAPNVQSAEEVSNTMG